jgi:hypothetical protein
MTSNDEISYLRYPLNHFSTSERYFDRIMRTHKIIKQKQYINLYLFCIFCRHQKGKQLLLFSLFSWIFFTFPLGLIETPATACIQRRNDTDYVLKSPDKWPRNMRRRREAVVDADQQSELRVPPGVDSLPFLENKQHQQVNFKKFQIIFKTKYFICIFLNNFF